jgi:hypothetical protein
MSKTVRALYLAIGILVFAAATVPWIAYFCLRAELRLPSTNNEPLFNLPDFLNTAIWVQAYIAWITFVVVAFATYQIYLIHRQTKIQQEQTEREAYLPLISPETVSARRLLNSKEVREILDDILSEMDDADDAPTLHFQEMLDATRKKIDSISKRMSWPLLHGTYASFDHIEMLLNQYNYLSKLINEHKLEKDFATDLGVANFKRVYQNAFAVIKLRRKLSGDSYANHFTKYCDNS